MCFPWPFAIRQKSFPAGLSVRFCDEHVFLLFSILQNGTENLIRRDLRAYQPSVAQKELLSDAVRNGISMVDDL